MAAAKTRVGTDAVVKITIGNAPEITVKNSDWEIESSNGIKETPNTSDGMVRAPGLDDYSGSFKGYSDDDHPIEVNVKAGTIARAKFYRTASAATYFDGDIIFEKVKISTGVVDEEKWEASFKKQSGVLYTPGSPRPSSS